MSPDAFDATLHMDRALRRVTSRRLLRRLFSLLAVHPEIRLLF
jgi:hypothetical protein